MTRKRDTSEGSAVTEGGRRPTVVTADGQPATDPEVVARTNRRRHTIAYKLKVIKVVADLRSEGHGAVGAFLRKEGLYYSTVRTWERLAAKGQLVSGQNGTKRQKRDALVAENKRLRRKNEQLEKRLAKTELIVELQKKLSAILALEKEAEDDRSDVR